jgi:hypothetical protein
MKHRAWFAAPAAVLPDRSSRQSRLQSQALRSSVAD